MRGRLAVASLWLMPLLAAAATVKMGTVAPEDSPWHRVLQETNEEWKKITGGTVSLKIYAGGVLGDETDMVKKLRVGQLQGVMLSGAGMEHLEPAVACMQIPLMISSDAELDYVRERVAPRMSRMLEDKGYVVLNWGDAGWVHFFSKVAVSTPDEVRKMKLFTSASDAKTIELYKASGFKPVPLAVTDMLTGLQTGMIDALDVPPLLALLNQWFGIANHMIDLKWAPLIGATVVSKKVWDKFPEAQRKPMLDAAVAANERARARIRAMNDEAITVMEKKGLQVTRLTPAQRKQWQDETEAVWPKLRGNVCPPDFFDEVKSLRDQYRASVAGPKK